MREKRFECVFVENKFGGTSRRLKDNETNITYMICDVADLLNFQNTQIKILEEENEQLKKAKKINMEYAEQIVEENQQLRIAKNDLRIENEQLREKNKQIGYLKRDLFILINLIRDTPMEFNCDFEKIVERWE